MTSAVSTGINTLKTNGCAMRIFEVRNRAYKPCVVAAADQDAAILMCRKIKHMRRHGVPRKVLDITDSILEEQPDIKAILDEGIDVILKKGEDGWVVLETK